MCSSGKITDDNKLTLAKSTCAVVEIHIEFAGPSNGSYYLFVLDNFSKWLEISKCKKATSSSTTGFLHAALVRFDTPDTIVPVNGTQFVSFGFQKF